MTERRPDKLKAMFTRSSSKIGPGSTIYSGLRTSLSLLKEVADATELPVLKGAVGGLLKVVEIIEKMAQNQDDAVELSRYLKGLEKLFNGAQNSKIPEALKSRIEELSQGIINIVQDIDTMKSQSTTVRFFKNDRDASTIAGHIQRINRLFSEFQFGSSVALESQMMVMTEDVTNIGRGVKVVTENMTRIGQQIIQDAIPRAVEARFDMDNRQRCSEGTRVALLDTVCRWALQKNSKDSETGASIFWLCGQAGTGKTTVCSSVADTCHAEGQLGASFFFSRDREDRNNIRLVFPTIAHQLGKFCKDFKVLVTEIYRNDPDLVYSDPPSQLENLIINPLEACISFPSGTIIIMDALDECKDDNPISTLLSMISKNRHRLSRLKFFISSRPENNIRLGFGPLREITQSLILHDIDTAVVNADLELYLRKGFSTAPTLYPYLVPERGWPSDEEITSLVNKSSRLFIFAATALKFIMDESYSDPIKQLTILLEQSQGVESSSSPFFYLDQMYLRVLHHAFPNSTPSDRLALLKMVLGAIVLLQHPLSPGDLEGLLGLRRGVIRTTLRHLHSIVVVPDTDADTLRLIHPSFFDFATVRCPDPKFRINFSLCHEQLATLCFEQMKMLKRDICEIKDASKLNKEIEDLPERIEQYLPPALRYACRHWIFHMCGATESPSLQTSLNEFCHKKLLYWIEVLSLIGPGSLRDGIRHIKALQTHLSNHSSSPNEFCAILKDTVAFIPEYFDLISSASLQLYRSALPLSSPSNSLRKAFAHELCGGVRVLQRAGEGTYSGVTVLRGHSDSVESAEFSPDGTLVVSANGQEVLLWDRGTGTLLKTLRMDTGDSVVIWAKFFPDGEQVISGSNEGSICIWDSTDGACLRTIKLDGVHEAILCYTCSPDVTRIVGSAINRFVRIWDVSTGSLLNTLRVPNATARSLAFSPNHLLIAAAFEVDDDDSNESDGSIDGGTAIFDGDDIIFEIHHAYPDEDDPNFNEGDAENDANNFDNANSDSNDASSDDGGTLRIWDAESGATLKTLQKGLTTVSALAFSPCSKYLVSGLESWDHDLYLWDISGGTTSKMNGHSHSVCSVAFSPSGNQIISGSNWGDLRVWNVVDGELVKTLRLGNGWSVKNAGFSFDGSHCICTRGNAIYIWDADRTLDLDRSEAKVRNIRFSPDGTRFAAFAGTVPCYLHLWDGLSGALLHVIDVGSPFFLNPVGPDLQFSPNNQFLASRLVRRIEIWDISSVATRKALIWHTGRINAVAFSSDSTQIVSTSDDKTLRIWNAASGDNIFTVKADHQVAHFSPDGSQIVADIHHHYDIPSQVRSHPVSFNNSAGQLRYSIAGEWVFASRGDKMERCIWLPIDWRKDNGVSNSGRVAIGTDNGLVLLDLSDITLSI